MKIRYIFAVVIYYLALAKSENVGWKSSARNYLCFICNYNLDHNEEEEDEDETKERKMYRDELVKGAIESAFWAMDRLILRDKQQYRISGGACTMVALFIFDKLYLANAGDSRAVCYLPNVSAY